MGGLCFIGYRLTKSRFGLSDCRADIHRELADALAAAVDA
jgi:hypothetical protein